MEIIHLCRCCRQKAKKDGVISGERHTLSMVGCYQLRHFVDITEKHDARKCDVTGLFLGPYYSGYSVVFFLIILLLSLYNNIQ